MGRLALNWLNRGLLWTRCWTLTLHKSSSEFNDHL